MTGGLVPLFEHSRMTYFPSGMRVVEHIFDVTWLRRRLSIRFLGKEKARG